MMGGLQYAIAPQVFRQFAGYVRGVVLAFGVENGPSSPELVALLQDAQRSVRDRLEIETLTEHAQIRAWREAYRAFGARPADFRSSIEALARRAVRGDQPLASISRLVDIGNVVSLRHLVPVGGHAIDVLTQDIELRPARGDEVFVAFGSDVVEHPLPGEIVFVERNTVLTRRWTWRQAKHTLMQADTADVEYNVDGLPPLSEQEVRAICSELEELVQRFCGGRVRSEILSADHPCVSLSKN
jgi:DNA/RNA-binding domain of Phe-tRNA-synthetase-like protein